MECPAVTLLAGTGLDQCGRGSGTLLVVVGQHRGVKLVKVHTEDLRTGPVGWNPKSRLYALVKWHIAKVPPAVSDSRT